MESNLQKFLEALPFLMYALGLVLILAGTGMSPNGLTKAVVVGMIGAVLAVAAGLLSQHARLPFPRTPIVPPLTLATSLLILVYGFWSHRRSLSDMAIPASLIAATGLFLFGWSI